MRARLRRGQLENPAQHAGTNCWGTEMRCRKPRPRVSRGPRRAREEQPEKDGEDARAPDLGGGTWQRCGGAIGPAGAPPEGAPRPKPVKRKAQTTSHRYLGASVISSYTTGHCAHVLRRQASTHPRAHWCHRRRSGYAERGIDFGLTALRTCHRLARRALPAGAGEGVDTAWGGKHSRLATSEPPPLKWNTTVRAPRAHPGTTTNSTKAV
ncbi:hypothetical protein NDU88_003149 [Pleurodeles waltl]|uniref:Uncharacterized protein n=1 Tax=Pleurodeles waltl TaxID=8319 RepID=A0AAV7LG92_PLEWA|nr:hypothetical protein NDU88_003149 [Pleurodeles waltl]